MNNYQFFVRKKITVEIYIEKSEIKNNNSTNRMNSSDDGLVKSIYLIILSLCYLYL